MDQKKRGRPRKPELVGPPRPPKKRGRPRKTPVFVGPLLPPKKRGRRPLSTDEKLVSLEQKRVSARLRYHALTEDEKSRRKAIAKAWREGNKGRIKATSLDWSLNNPDRVAAKTVRYRLAKLRRAPSALTNEDLEQIALCYERAASYRQLFATDVHVDHVIPLQGRDVSGLHVPWNLRIVFKTQNLTKSRNRCPSEALASSTTFEDSVCP